MVVSERLRSVLEGASATRKMFEEGLRLKALHGENAVADMSLGNPIFDPPAAFGDALQRFASSSMPHGYMSNAGFPDVRERVAAWLEEHGYFRGIGMHHVVMTVGAASAINVVLKVLLDPGDEVIVLAPYFSEYRFYIDNHRGAMIVAGTAPDFSLDLAEIERVLSTRTKAILVNSPNNPTGKVYPDHELRALADLLRRHSRQTGRPVYLISDEPYREIIYDDVRFTSPASLYENSFMCYSWSKSFNLAGERIGYVAVNPAMETDDMAALSGALSMCHRILGFVNAPAIIQKAVAASIDAPVDIEPYRVRRDQIAAALSRGGYRFTQPEGTFYFFPEAPDDGFFARATKNLLLVVPGSAYGCDGFFRMSFACPESVVDLACRKLGEVIR